MLLLFVLCIVRYVEPAIAGDRLVFHVPITYKNVHMTKTRHVPEIINRHVHVKTKYMHVYHPKKIVQEMPPTFPEQQQHQQLIDPASMWMPSGAMAAAAPPLAPTPAMAAAFSSMVQEKLSSQLAQELMMRYRNLETPASSALGESAASESDYLRDYYRQQRKLSDQLMLQEAMQLPNFAQTKYLSSMGWDWDKSFGVKPSDAADQPLPVKKSKKKKKDFKTYSGL
ncbi:hypothetical protein ZHAS_00021450 [Anopheles sinensis]|uniref:Uncharacterized protein n=1 Tax=Anopheles sinensis TaxID=74873 RepID=A0A084WSF7_ANOSI|nr:hypothetical protein ZHAS_00021450 [Anopheles sinensis]